MEQLRTELERYQNIQVAAYHCWLQRGCPFGSPEVDWFQAERLLEQGDVPKEPTVVAVAKVMGAALGAIAGIAASVGSLARSDEQ